MLFINSYLLSIAWTRWKDASLEDHTRRQPKGKSHVQIMISNFVMFFALLGVFLNANTSSNNKIPNQNLNNSFAYNPFSTEQYWVPASDGAAERADGLISRRDCFCLR